MNPDAISHYNRPRRHASLDSQRNPARPERPPALDGPAFGAGAAGGLNTHLCSLALTRADAAGAACDPKRATLDTAPFILSS